MNRILDSAVSVNSLVFSGGEVWNEDEPVDANLQILVQPVGPSGNANETGQDNEEKISTYVRVFEDMVCTVIKEETHLLNDEEFALLTIFAHLSYNARFLMVKLLLRKQDTWHRLDTLKYEDELASVSAIVSAIDELCQVAPDTSGVVRKEEPEQGSIDPMMAETVAALQQEQDKPTSVNVGALGPLSEDKPLVLARSEREMDLKSLLECMRLDELKAVAKQLKLKANKKKADLIKDLLGTSSSQSTLTDFTCKDATASSKEHSHQQTKLSFKKLRSQQDRLKEIVLRYIVRCVRVDEDFFGVIHRVNLVYFRMTRYTPGILVAALLTRFRKRAYPGYNYERTRNVWTTRQGLLDYEEVLMLEGEIDMLLAGNVPSGGGVVGTKTPVARPFSTPITPGITNDSREGDDPGDEDNIFDVKPDSTRVRGARMVKDIFERVYPRWRDLVKANSENVGRAVGLERFHHGYVLTRIICKGSTALGILGEHEKELEVLEALLAQKRWRRGQCGRWYERRALILSTYFPKDEKIAEQALDAVIEALRDPDTHIVFRLKLQRRLRRLENRLKIPVRERHTCDGVVVDANEVVFEAVRLRHRAVGLKLDRIGRCIDANTPQQEHQDIKRYYSPVATPAKPESSSSVASASRSKVPLDVQKGKSLWLGRNGEELTVENLALQRYEDQGFRGVHSETRIISMLFSLLFWDIIFKPIPGAFETPYQTAPLDIAEDSFYHARKDLMEERLAAIEAGKGVKLIQDADAQNRTSETWCVGVRWGLFSSEDLVNIVTCIGGKALAVICRVLCEDYTFGTSGGPDLFLWNAEKGTCMFVEVKGPGDVLQENQRIWIDILLKAPVAVEICRVVESGCETDKKLNARTPKSTRKKPRKVLREEEEAFGDAGDADALPNTFYDPHTTIEDQPVSNNVGPPGPRSLHIITCSGILATPSTPTGETSGPLKRKASPGPRSPTPSKRPRPS